VRSWGEVRQQESCTGEITIYQGVEFQEHVGQIVNSGFGRVESHSVAKYYHCEHLCCVTRLNHSFERLFQFTDRHFILTWQTEEVILRA